VQRLNTLLHLYTLRIICVSTNTYITEDTECGYSFYFVQLQKYRTVFLCVSLLCILFLIFLILSKYWETHWICLYSTVCSWVANFNWKANIFVKRFSYKLYLINSFVHSSFSNFRKTIVIKFVIIFWAFLLFCWPRETVEVSWRYFAKSRIVLRQRKRCLRAHLWARICCRIRRCFRQRGRLIWRTRPPAYRGRPQGRCGLPKRGKWHESCDTDSLEMRCIFLLFRPTQDKGKNVENFFARFSLLSLLGQDFFINGWKP